MAIGTDIKTFRINYHKTSSSSISDLTGTKRVFNDEINHASTAATLFAINFISNNTNYTYIKFGGTSGSIRYSENGTSYVEVYNSGQEPPFIAGWTDNAYKTIEITSGTDATNSDLITFLQANATQQIDTSITFELTESGVYKARVCAAGYSPSAYSNSITYPSSPYDPVFSNNTPQQLAAAFDSGEIPSTWSVGDYIDVTLTNGSIVRVMLIHKTSATSNYKYNDDDTTCPFILSVMNFVGNNHVMNSSSTNAGGWNGSKMRTYVNSSTFLDLFPNDWKSCLARLKVKAMNGGSQSGTTLVESADKMFLFAEKEYYGAVKYSSSTEGNALNQLDYYANLGVTLSNYSALRKGATPTASYSPYWERSAYASGTNFFCYVYDWGNANYYNPIYSFGVVVGFSLSLTHTS